MNADKDREMSQESALESSVAVNSELRDTERAGNERSLQAGLVQWLGTR